MGESWPQTKDELLRRIQAARAELRRTLDGLSDEQLSAPGPDAGWSIKDHLAHIAAWERHAVSIARGDQPYDTFGAGVERFAAMGLDDINALVYEQNRDLSLGEALAAFHGAYNEMLALVESLEDADLAKSYFHDEPEATRTALDGIANNSYLHDAEHAGWIRELLVGRAEA